MRKLGALLLIIPLVGLMAAFLWETQALDACLAQGGSFDYLNSLCDLKQEHPFIPFSARHPLLVNGGMLLSLLGFIFCLIGFYIRPRNR